MFPPNRQQEHMTKTCKQKQNIANKQTNKQTKSLTKNTTKSNTNKQSITQKK